MFIKMLNIYFINNVSDIVELLQMTKLRTVANDNISVKLLSLLAAVVLCVQQSIAFYGQLHVA